MPFDPNEPRDERGRWTDSGGGSTDIMTRFASKIGSAIKKAASDAVNILMRKAKDASAELNSVADQVAQAVGGINTGINLKSEARIKEKAEKEYGGDVSKVKDAVRTTIVVPYDKLEHAAQELKKFVGTDGRVKIQDGPEFFGYKGVLSNVRLSNGIMAEIQVNSPGMLYAKEAKKDNTKFLTDQQYADIKAKTGLEGGLGHVYYEQIRSLSRGAGTEHMTPEVEKKVNGLIQQSNKYYSHFYGF